MKEETIDLKSLVQGAVGSPKEEKEDFCEAQLIVDCRCELGEGVVYDERSQTVLWTDILGKKYHELELNCDDPSKVKFRTFDSPKMLGSFGMLADSQNSPRPLLCAWEDGFQIYDFHVGKELSELSSGEPVNPSGLPTRLNDGRVDPTGSHYICGGYYGDIQGKKMKVFDVAQKNGKLSHIPIVESIEVTNSLSFSPDGSKMYLADSPTRTISAYDYDDGKISNKNPFHCKPESEKGVPDGSCVDEEGYLWNAVWRSGHGPAMVQRIDPKTGAVIFTVHMPDSTSQVTCCCFGGKDMNILFITSAAESRDCTLEPHAGGLYAVILPFKGRHESRLNFNF